MATQINSPRLPSPKILAGLQTSIANARIAERTKREAAARAEAERRNAPPPPSAAEIKRQKEELLLAELRGFLSITDRSDDEIRTGTERLKKSFAPDVNLERHLEKIYEQTDGKELKTMILKMLLVLGNGYADLLATRLDPKHADHEFAKQFFGDLSNDDIRKFIHNIRYPNEGTIDALLGLKDRRFVIDAISKEGTKERDSYARNLLFLTVQKLAPDFDFKTVSRLFEVGVNHNGDYLRRDVAELMRTKYPAQARDYFKQVAETKNLSKEEEDSSFSVGLRIAGIRNYALVSGETASADLKRILLAEQSIDLADAIVSLLSDAAICGINGRELVADIVDERQSRQEPPLELYWLAMDGCVYSPTDGQLKEVDDYHDLLKVVFSKVSNGEKLLENLNAMGTNVSRVLWNEELLKGLARRDLLPSTHREGIPVDRLINRIGIERLADWALQNENALLSENAWSLLNCCTGERLDKVRRVTEAIGLAAA